MKVLKIPFLIWLFQGIPEAIALTALVISLTTDRLMWKTILIAGFGQALVIYIIRLMPLTPGIHVIIHIITLAIIVTIVSGFEFKEVLIYSLFATFSLMLIEMMFLLEFYDPNSLYFGVFKEYVYIHIIKGLPQVIIMLCLAFINTLFKKKFQ